MTAAFVADRLVRTVVNHASAHGSAKNAVIYAASESRVEPVKRQRAPLDVIRVADATGRGEALAARMNAAASASTRKN
jgi:hypothetical protein